MHRLRDNTAQAPLVWWPGSLGLDPSLMTADLDQLVVEYGRKDTEQVSQGSPWHLHAVGSTKGFSEVFSVVGPRAAHEHRQKELYYRLTSVYKGGVGSPVSRRQLSCCCGPLGAHSQLP